MNKSKNVDKKFSDFSNDIEFIEKKIKNVKKNKKGFSKSTILDPLESIYDDDTNPLSENIYRSFSENAIVGEEIKETLDNMSNTTATQTPTSRPTSNTSKYTPPPVNISPSGIDFADIWLYQELARDGDPNPDGSNPPKKTDEWCKNNPLAGNIYVNDFQKFLKMVEYPTVYTEYFIKKIGIYIGNILSTSTATDQEKKIIIKNLNILFTLTISIIIVYNWFFVLFYRDEENNKTKVFDVNYRFFEDYTFFLDYIFRFTLYPVDFVDKIFRNWFTWGVNSVFKYVTISWIVLFVFVFCIVYYWGQFFTDLYYQSLNILLRGVTTKHYGSSSPASISYYYFNILIVYALFTFYFSPVNIISFVFSPLVGVATLILSIMISCYLVSIPGILIPFYLFVYSFFAIFIYSKKSWFQTYKDINVFIGKSIFEDDNECTAEDGCSNKSIFENFIDFIKLIVDLIYKYTFSISFIVILVYSIIDYYKNINTVNLKSNLINITVFVIIVIVTYLYYENRTSILEDLNEISENSKK
jgi:hypothetical protein